jgi:Fe2+ transport system protein FeoA
MNEPMSSCTHPEGCKQAELCPLSRVVAGSSVRIKQLSTPPEVTHRLRELGLCEEQSIRLLSSHSNFICLVCNARLGISSQLADNILVELLPAHSPRG